VLCGVRRAADGNIHPWLRDTCVQTWFERAISHAKPINTTAVSALLSAGICDPAGRDPSLRARLLLDQTTAAWVFVSDAVVGSSAHQRQRKVAGFRSAGCMERHFL